MSFTSPAGSVSSPSQSHFVTSSTPVSDAAAQSRPDGQASGFVDRRESIKSKGAPGERRQFGSAHLGLTEDGRELATAIDRYKLEHHRRYITCDEMLAVLRTLGYDRVES